MLNKIKQSLKSKKSQAANLNKRDFARSSSN